MKDYDYLIAVGLAVLLFLHMILTPLLRPDKEERSRDYSRAYRAFRQMEKEVASWSH